MKLQKKMENEVHEQLYSNILLLSFSYPVSKDFISYFKKDMFVKNNKAAFQHVVHFLVNILEPHFFELKSIWPILDVKMESKFRNEVIKFIKELNLSNKETGIPLIMTSHLISPGGYQFAKFVFKLSQFVLSEHIKKDSNYANLILPPAINKDYNISSEQVNNLNKVIDDQYNNLAQMQKTFNSNYEEIKTRMDSILQHVPILEQKVENSKQRIDEFNRNSTNVICTVYGKELENRDGFFDEKITKLCADKDVLKECSVLIDILNANKNIVEKCTQHVDNIQSYKYKKHTDLLEHFEILLQTLKNNKYILKNRRDFNLPDYVIITAEIANSLKDYSAKYEELFNEFSVFKMLLQVNTAKKFNREDRKSVV